MLLPTASAVHEDDARLVQRLRDGDEQAFDAIVTRHRPRLLAFARRILSRRTDVAEDVVQEALLRAHRALLRDDRPIMLGPWLAKLTRNCALDEISRVKADTVALDAPAALPALVDGDDPAAVHERRASVRGMLEGIATLPEEQRHALLRREVDGASHADIAAELSITGAASRALIFRARENLTKHREATDARCSEIQAELLRVQRTGRRGSAHVYRHLATCKHCRAYRGQLRAMRDALHVLHPGGMLFLGAVAVKLGFVGKGAIAGVAAKSPAAIGTVVALTAAAAVGGTLVITAGQPSPFTIHSPVLPNHVILKGQLLPPNTAVAMKTVELSTRGTVTVRLGCPARGGYRVADLLPPDTGGVTAGYVSGTLPGIARAATVTLTGPPSRRVGIAMLCGVPNPSGALTPTGGAQPHTAIGPVVVACVARDYLRSSPHGGVIGSVRGRDPLHVQRRVGGAVQVQTQFGATGWLPATDLCD